MIDANVIATATITNINIIAEFGQSHAACLLNATAGVAYAGLANWYFREAHRTPAVFYACNSLVHAGLSWVALVGH